MPFQDNYFDLWDILTNEIVGDVWLFLIVGLLIVIYFGIKSKIPHEVLGLLALIWLVVIFSGATQLLILWVFVVLMVGTMFYYAVSKVIGG